jgi:hypothetical protein
MSKVAIHRTVLSKNLRELLGIFHVLEPSLTAHMQTYINKQREE